MPTWTILPSVFFVSHTYICILCCKVLGAHILCALVPWINLNTINGWKTWTRNSLLHQRRQGRRPPMDLPIHWQDQLASDPGLLIPAFVACTTNVGEGLAKLSHVVWRTWTCGGKAHSRENSKWVRYRIANMNRRKIEHSTSDSLGDISCYTTVQKECATPPHVRSLEVGASHREKRSL